MFFLSCAALLAYIDFGIAPVLPQAKISEQFVTAEEEFQYRWEEFKEGRTFAPFHPGRSDADLESEFLKLDDARYKVWYRNPENAIKESAIDYEVSLPLLFQDLVRAKNCTAFAYNNLTPYYNASSMKVGGRYCIACEGTRSKDIPKFFTLLIQYQVTHLVRLTASYEGEKKKCHPYWEGLLSQHEGEWILHVPFGDYGNSFFYPVHYYIEEEWGDNKGASPRRLLALVRKVKKDLDAEKKSLLTVHCSAGVGRTGTFLAALAIVDRIDRREPFSIEEIVFQLSLQRVFSVAQPSQYISLHRLAEEYLQCSTSY